MIQISNSVIIKNLFTGHIRQIIEIERVCFIDPWSEEWFEAFILSDEISWGAYIDRKLVAYLFAVSNEQLVHLVNVAVKADYRRQGIARMLVSALYESAIKSKLKHVILEVRRSNLTAIDFYTDEGFLLTDEKSGYYQGGEDALIFQKELRK
ncbi:MAG: ribosomal protein S18-alanine N-acetyltransferase [Calditrichaeota bacterium]|nr:ribosomal protein S18-alanine N-acetyltransferase [Calditrichota bacterium]